MWKKNLWDFHSYGLPQAGIDNRFPGFPEKNLVNCVSCFSVQLLRAIVNYFSSSNSGFGSSWTIATVVSGKLRLSCGISEEIDADGL